MTVARYGLAAVAAAVMAASGLGVAAASPGDNSDLREVVLTDADNGRAVAVTPGETVTVRLDGVIDRGLVWSWSVPAASTARVLARTAGATTPDGGADGAFRADAPGSADITSVRKCVSSSGDSCSKIAVPWKVVVTVEVG